MPTRSPQKGLDFQSKMLQFINLESGRKHIGTQLSHEDRSLLEDVLARTRTTPGVSKSENLALTKKREASMLLNYSKSVGSSPIKGLCGARLGLEHQNSHILDVLDGLRS